jgi:Tfp pilus assembly protein PilF
MLGSILASKGDAPGALAERKIAADLSRSAMRRQRASFALESGRALLNQGHIPEAIVQLNNAIAAEPDSKEAHLLLAQALQKQGRPADAMAEQQKAEQEHPEAKSPQP